VIDSFQQLIEATFPDFTPIYTQLAAHESIPAGNVLESDAVFQRGSGEGWAADGDI
jgi:phenylalanine-4-hydroxylase